MRSLSIGVEAGGRYIISVRVGPKHGDLTGPDKGPIVVGDSEAAIVSIATFGEENPLPSATIPFTAAWVARRSTARLIEVWLFTLWFYPQ
jgi:hypothetical protein